MSAKAISALRELGCEPQPHVSREVTQELVERADAIYCMTDQQCRELALRFPAATWKLQRLDPVGNVEDSPTAEPADFLRVATRIRDSSPLAPGKPISFSSRRIRLRQGLLTFERVRLPCRPVEIRHLFSVLKRLPNPVSSEHLSRLSVGRYPEAARNPHSTRKQRNCFPLFSRTDVRFFALRSR